MRVTVTPEILASLNTVSVGASKDDIAPVITQIALTNDGGTFRAMTTDRYVVVSGKYYDAELEDWYEGDTLLVDPKTVKMANDAVKAAGRGGTHHISIAKNEAGGALIQVNDSLFQSEPVTAAFPAVAKLFKDEGSENGAPILALNPENLAKLAKVLPPVTRPNKSEPWTFRFFTDASNGKPAPVQASKRDGGYKMEVLIQPNLLVR